MDPWLSVGEVATRSGVPVSALHFYERKGLLAAERSAGNQRRYGRDVLRRAAFIRTAQRVGVSLRDIGAALEEIGDRNPTKRDWARISRRWRAMLDDRIRDLEHLRDDLDGCIGCGCLSLRSCAVYNSDDTLGEEGDGPRRWG